MSTSQRPYLCERCRRSLGDASIGPDGRITAITVETAAAVVDCTLATSVLHCYCGHGNHLHSGITVVLEERPLDRFALGITTEEAA